MKGDRIMSNVLKFSKLKDFIEVFSSDCTAREEAFIKFRLGIDKEFSEKELETDIKTLFEQNVISGRTQEEQRQNLILQ